MKKGFTILELLVVISVLVILIGIAIPRFKGMQDAGRIAQAKTELQTLQAAVESYYTNNSSTHNYPPTSTTIGATNLTGTTPQIISAALVDPFSTTNGEYNYVFNSPYYVIASIGTGTSTSTLSVSSTTGGVTKNTGNLCVTNGASGC